MHAEYKQRFEELQKEGKIVHSNATFKVQLFLSKAEQSLLIAQHNKDITPTIDQASKFHWNYWAITISYYSMLYAAKAAILTKGYEVRDHYAAYVALAALFLSDELEKEDLALLDQAHKIFEDEYLASFEQARIESHTARYHARPNYTERQVERIFENATTFIAKITLLL